MAFSPDGKSLLVLTGGYHDHGVSVIDPAINKVTQSVNLGKVWAGMCFDAEGDDVYVSGGGPPSAEFLTNAAKQGAGCGPDRVVRASDPASEVCGRQR